MESWHSERSEPCESGGWRDRAPPPVSDFHRLGPNTVEHADGWRVRNLDRWLVAYEDGDAVAEVEVERGLASNTLYPDTLRWTTPVRREVTVEERRILADRLLAGLAELSGKAVEVGLGGS